MGRGTHYEFIENILKAHGNPNGRVLEIAAGGAVYRNIFKDYVGTDLAGNPYAESGDINAFCDAQNIPFKAGTFDTVFIVAALYQIPDASRVSQEAKRILRPDGVFLVFDYNRKTTSRLKQKERGGNNKNHVWSPAELRTMLRDNGFDAKIINHHAYSSATQRGMMKKVKTTTFYRWLKDWRSGDWNVVLARK